MPPPPQRRIQHPQASLFKNDASSESSSESSRSSIDTRHSESLERPYDMRFNVKGGLLAGVLADGKTKEPLRCGDIIQYHDPLLVAGAHSARIAQVWGITPHKKTELPLTLSSGDYLPRNTLISRIRVMMEGELYPHQGIPRAIRDFRLQAGSMQPTRTSQDECQHLFQKFQQEVQEMAAVFPSSQQKHQPSREDGNSNDSSEDSSSLDDIFAQHRTSTNAPHRNTSNTLSSGSHSKCHTQPSQPSIPAKHLPHQTISSCNKKNTTMDFLQTDSSDDQDGSSSEDTPPPRKYPSPESTTQNMTEACKNNTIDRLFQTIVTNSKSRPIASRPSGNLSFRKVAPKPHIQMGRSRNCEHDLKDSTTIQALLDSDSDDSMDFLPSSKRSPPAAVKCRTSPKERKSDVSDFSPHLASPHAVLAADASSDSDGGECQRKVSRQSLDRMGSPSPDHDTNGSIVDVWSQQSISSFRSADSRDSTRKKMRHASTVRNPAGTSVSKAGSSYRLEFQSAYRSSYDL